MKSGEPLLSSLSNHRHITAPAATEPFKPAATNETTSNQADISTSSQKPASSGAMAPKENSFLVNSNHHRNIINHFFSQIKVKVGNRHHHHHSHQHKPIIKTTDSQHNPHTTTMPNPSSNIFITSTNSATQITIHELQHSKTNSTYQQQQQQQTTNHVHFTSPLPINPTPSLSNNNGNNFTINTINLLPINNTNNTPSNNQNGFSLNTPTLINNINVNNINGFHSASVNKLSTTTSQHINNCVKFANSSNGLQPLNNKNLNLIRSSSFRHKNANPINSNTKLGTSTKINHQFNTPFSHITPTPNAAPIITKDTSKSVENLANFIKTENNSIIPDSSLMSSTRRIGAGDDFLSFNTPSNTHTLNRLVKIASSWQAKSRSSSNASNYQQTTIASQHAASTTSIGQHSSSKTIDRGLISQSKIRQTQMFINESLECVNSESALLRKLGESTTPQNKYNTSSNGDEQDAAFRRTKSLRLPKTSIKLSSINKPNIRGPNDVVESTSLIDSSKVEINEPYSNINYWKPNETTTNTLISDVGGANLNDLQSGRNSFILSRKNSRSIEFLNFNQKAGAKLQKVTNNNISMQNQNLSASKNQNYHYTNENKNVPTPQLSKHGQFAIETQ